MVGPRSGVVGLDNPTLPKITAVAALGAPLRSARGFATRPRLCRSYTTTWDATSLGDNTARPHSALKGKPPLSRIDSNNVIGNDT